MPAGRPAPLWRGRWIWADNRRGRDHLATLARRGSSGREKGPHSQDEILQEQPGANHVPHASIMTRILARATRRPCGKASRRETGHLCGHVPIFAFYGRSLGRGHRRPFAPNRQHQPLLLLNRIEMSLVVGLDLGQERSHVEIAGLVGRWLTAPPISYAGWLRVHERI